MAISVRINPLPCVALLACLGIAACVYKVPVQQGNVITVEMLQELKLGMDKRKVKFILGTPLVKDVFHQDRWDYFYSYDAGYGDAVQQQASLYFENDRLVRINADIDSNIDFHTVTHATDKVVIVPKKEDSGFFAALTPAFVKRDEEEQEQDAIERSLDSGFNEPQPGSEQASAAGTGGEVLDPAVVTPAIVAPELEESALPSEVYAPNTSASIETAAMGPAPPVAAAEVISPETASQSRYLEQLFDDFGAAPESEPQTAAATEAVQEQPEPVVIRRGDPSATTRD